MKKALFVYGTRPEAIKMAPVIQAMSDHPNFHPVVCLTGQHREMLDQVNQFFQIKGDYDLNVMTPGQDLFDVSSKILLGLREVLRSERPDVVIVQGDTTSTLMGALAAFYERLPIGHIEAGLRTHNLTSPFPEEANRVLATRLTDFHFAPTEKNASNLINEGVAKNKIWITGNTGIDALFLAAERVKQAYEPVGDLGSAYGLVKEKKPYVLITGHRRESFGQGFQQICEGISQLANKWSEWSFVYPAHPNPNVQGPVNACLSGIKNVHLIPPLAYPDFVYLMDGSSLILTDSGGVQEEAPSLGKPVLVMRDNTERPEAVEAGTVKLVGASAQKIFSSADELIAKPELRLEMTRAHNPYGDGRASSRILEALLESL